MALVRNRNHVASITAKMAAAALLAVSLLINCQRKPTIQNSDDRSELISYLETTAEGRSLFRTAGFVRDDPYAKPDREGVVFRDVLDSVTRDYFTNVPSHFVEKDFGPPIGIVDDAEVEIQDVFHVSIFADSAGETLPPRRQQRVLRRSAYFLRLRSENYAYSGWLMHGYNGGMPRNAWMEIKLPSGNMFRGDGLGFERFQYMKYVTSEWYGDDDRLDSITVDTIPGRSDNAYLLLQNVGRVTRGDDLYVESIEVDNISLFQIISAETASGPAYRSMHRPDSARYVDTIQTVASGNHVWDVLFFQEFQGPGIDRPGGIWCVPYRLQK